MNILIEVAASVVQRGVYNCVGSIYNRLKFLLTL